MIITKTPFRISFAGGGSDLEEFYAQSPGAVLSATINKYMYLSTHRFFEKHRLRIKYSKTETVDCAAEVRHPIVREVLRQFQVEGALEISSNADVPAGTGLGSSSAFTVGLLHNMHTVFGRFVTKAQLAAEACEIEINRLGEPIGKQDQYAAAFGGLNVIEFLPSGQVEVGPIHLPREVYETLQANLLLFYVGHARSAATILGEQKANMQVADKVGNVKRMVELVWELREALYAGELHRFGEILDRGWRLKQGLAAAISDPRLDGIYERALAAGAAGGKLLGAGGGGFMLFYCEPENQAVLRAAMTHWELDEMRFRFDNEGSKLIYVGDEYES